MLNGLNLVLIVAAGALVLALLVIQRRKQAAGAIDAATTSETWAAGAAAQTTTTAAPAGRRGFGRRGRRDEEADHLAALEAFEAAAQAAAVAAEPIAPPDEVTAHAEVAAALEPAEPVDDPVAGTSETPDEAALALAETAASAILEAPEAVEEHESGRHRRRSRRGRRNGEADEAAAFPARTGEPGEAVEDAAPRRRLFGRRARRQDQVSEAEAFAAFTAASDDVVYPPGHPYADVADAEMEETGWPVETPQASADAPEAPEDGAEVPLSATVAPDEAPNGFGFAAVQPGEPDWDGMRAEMKGLSPAPAAETPVEDADAAPVEAIAPLGAEVPRVWAEDELITEPGWPLPGDLEEGWDAVPGETATAAPAPTFGIAADTDDAANGWLGEEAPFEAADEAPVWASDSAEVPSAPLAEPAWATPETEAAWAAPDAGSAWAAPTDTTAPIPLVMPAGETAPPADAAVADGETDGEALSWSAFTAGTDLPEPAPSAPPAPEPPAPAAATPAFSFSDLMTEVEAPEATDPPAQDDAGAPATADAASAEDLPVWGSFDAEAEPVLAPEHDDAAPAAEETPLEFPAWDAGDWTTPVEPAPEAAAEVAATSPVTDEAPVDFPAWDTADWTADAAPADAPVACDEQVAPADESPLEFPAWDATDWTADVTANDSAAPEPTPFTAEADPVAEAALPAFPAWDAAAPSAGTAAVTQVDGAAEIDAEHWLDGLATGGDASWAAAVTPVAATPWAEPASVAPPALPAIPDVVDDWTADAPETWQPADPAPVASAVTGERPAPAVEVPVAVTPVAARDIPVSVTTTITPLPAEAFTFVDVEIRRPYVETRPDAPVDPTDAWDAFELVRGALEPAAAPDARITDPSVDEPEADAAQVADVAVACIPEAEVETLATADVAPLDAEPESQAEVEAPPAADPQTAGSPLPEDDRLTGRFAIGGMALQPGHEALAAVTFREALRSGLPVRWGFRDGDTAEPGTLVVSVEATMNCTAEDLAVMFDPGFAPTTEGFTVRLASAAKGPFAASGTFWVVP